MSDNSGKLPGIGRQRGRIGGSRRDARSLLFWATLLTALLWLVPYSDYVLYPLRLFVTFVHESGHAVATVLSGGMVDSLTVHPDGSGVTRVRTSPFWSWLSLSGGYLGAALFGALMLQVGRLRGVRNAGKSALAVAGALVLLAALLWSMNPLTNLFTLATGLALAALLFLTARFASPGAADLLASFLAVQCCLNALLDLRTLLYLTSARLGDNDAVFMSEQYGLPPLFWAGAWALTALLILGVALRSYWRASAGAASSRR